MRRPAAMVVGTLTGALLMVAAKLGTPPPLGGETVAEAPLDAVPAGSPGAATEPTADPSAGPGSPGPSGEPQPGVTSTADPTGPTTTAAAARPGGLRNGTFTGSAITHKYGTLQVSVVVSGGTIGDIRWTYTTSSPLSQKINADALPLLRSEALAIQSAQVDTVSGATYTSSAYRTSLQSAIDKAT